MDGTCGIAMIGGYSCRRITLGLGGHLDRMLSSPRSFVGFVIPGLAGRLEGLLGTFVYGHCISHNEDEQALEPSRARFGFDRIDDGFSIRMKIRHGSCLDDR
jgi:hypothetical protein